MVGSRFYGIYASVNSRCAHPPGHYFFFAKVPVGWGRRKRANAPPPVVLSHTFLNAKYVFKYFPIALQCIDTDSSSSQVVA